MMASTDHYLHRQFTACMYEDYENESANANQQKNGRTPMLIKSGIAVSTTHAITALPAATLTTAIPFANHVSAVAPPNGRPRRHHLGAVQQPHVTNGRLQHHSDTTIVPTSGGAVGVGPDVIAPSTVSNSAASVALKKHKMAKSNYKHVPHREKPVHLVERRNARERRRVQAVNGAFARLRKCVPLENRNKRLSKVKTLQKAIDYIYQLQQVLDDEEQEERERYERLQATNAANIVKDNACDETSRWITSCMETANQRHSPYIGMYESYPPFQN